MEEKLSIKTEELLKFQNAYITYLHKRMKTLEEHMETFQLIDRTKTRKINNLRVNLSDAQVAIRKYKKQIKYMN